MNQAPIPTVLGKLNVNSVQKGIAVRTKPTNQSNVEWETTVLKEMQLVVNALLGLHVSMDNHHKYVLKGIMHLLWQLLALLALQALNVLLRVWGHQQHVLWEPTQMKQDNFLVLHARQGTAVWDKMHQRYVQLDNTVEQRKQAALHVV